MRFGIPTRSRNLSGLYLSVLMDIVSDHDKLLHGCKLLVVSLFFRIQRKSGLFTNILSRRPPTTLQYRVGS